MSIPDLNEARLETAKALEAANKILHEQEMILEAYMQNTATLLHVRREIAEDRTNLRRVMRVVNDEMIKTSHLIGKPISV